jgi:type III pantothenate kinase
MLTSDQFGVFLLGLLREHNLTKQQITEVAIASVVPQLDYSIRAACLKYFELEPFFLKLGAKTGIKILYKNPQEVGADLIAGAIAAVQHYPNQNILVFDLGTATTCIAVSKNKEFHGGAFFPGLRLSMKSLQSNTAKLSSVEIVQPKQFIGRSTIECTQSGIYYGHLGVMKELIARFTEQLFPEEEPKIIGTGGFAQLYLEQQIFDVVLPDLVLEGLNLAAEQNKK